ncbi:hypothetical protein WOLCODRAFT_143038 [Wolfiporia cocos MD-104 SS10]|uniref:Uncharacterized protein n=1 Tax=Wolfiporia cocos (strain MD-104) TaxID=742152 RepID=A0A2H3JEM3_WOLCO|nr:hypothetical protein WOLCODRAFT_143038 [Wolfiporia cocos MD-104 SS10]
MSSVFSGTNLDRFIAVHWSAVNELIVYDSIQSPYHHILPHLLGRHVSKISTLTLVGHGGVSETPAQRLLVDPGFLMLVPMFASVTSLVLRNYTLDSYGDLIRLISSFPQLQALSLCGLHLKSQLESLTGAPNLPSTFQRKSHALRLRTLYMYLNPQMTLSILEGLAVTPTCGSLREIEIYGSFEGYFGWSENDHRYAVHTLRSFRIGQDHRRLVLTPNNRRDNSVSFGLIYRENIPSVHRTQVEEISRWQDLWMTIKGILTDPSVKGQLHRIVIHLYLPTTLQATTQGLISLTPQSDHTPVARIGEVTSQRVFDSYTAVTIKMHCAPKYTLSSAERVAVYIKTEGAIQGQLSKWDKRHILELSRSTWNGDWSLVNFEA